MFQFTDEDIKRSVLLDPGEWYNITVKDYQKNKDSEGADLHVYTLETYGHENQEFNNVPVRFQLSEKAPGFAIPFFRGLGLEIKKGVDYSKHFPLFKGRRLKGRLEHKLYQGVPQNNFVDFKPVKEEGLESTVENATEKEAF